MLLNLKNISKQYTIPSRGIVRSVLNQCNLQVVEGETIAIKGPSGSGKTTLLNLIGTLDKPTAGSIFFKDKDITAFNGKALLQYRNQHIGFVFQKHHLLPQCTLWENVLIPTLALKSGAGDINVYAEHLIKTLGLWDIRYQKPSELSGGECQRTALARALINKPHLLLADEPTGALDTENATELVKLILEVNKLFNTAVIMVTHSNNAAGQLQKIYSIEQGNLALI